MIFGYLMSIAILIDVAILGLLITYLFKLEFLLEARIAAAALIGIIALGVLMFFASYFFGLNFLNLIFVIASINLATFAVLIRCKKNSVVLGMTNEWIDLRNRFKHLSWKAFFLFIGFFVSIFSYLASQLLIFSKGSFFISPIHSYGDISLHLGIISSFAYGNNFPPQSSILSNTKISYPFLIDFITAIFVNPLFLRFDQAVSLVGIVMIAILIIMLTYFALRITGSKLAACLSIILFVFNGGLGFLYFYKDLQTSNLNFFQFIQVLPKDYTALKEIGFYWINVVISMFLPQRSFLLGLPVAILILYIFWDLSERFEVKKLFFGILLASFLPIIHAHSMVALSPFLGFLIILMIIRNKQSVKPLLFFGFIGAVMIFVLSKLYLQQSDNPFSFINFKLGWMAPKGELINFYINNFGFNLLLIPISIFLGLIKKIKLALFALIGQIWFILPSLFLFQPWDFDNTKLFIYWYLSSVFIVAYFLSKLILTRQITNIILVGTVIYLLVFSGFLDVTRLAFISGTRYEIYSPQAIRLAEFVKQNIRKDAVFLSVDKFDNPVVALAGRKVVVGYHGWLWTYGLDYSQRDLDIRNMLSGNASLEMFQKYGITNVVFFNESTDYLINKDYFKQYRIIYNQDGYTIFQI